jgi:transposase
VSEHAATARRYGISTSLLFMWRRAHRQSASQPCDAGFVPAMVVPDVRPAVPAGSRRIEIALANRRRMIVDGGVDIAVLCQLVEALERR